MPILKVSDDISIYASDEIAEAIVGDPERFMDFCRQIANGGSIKDICKRWNVNYGDLYAAIAINQKLSKVYHMALEARRHFDVEEMLEQMRALATSDVRSLFNPDGSLKHPNEMTAEESACIQSFEVETEINETDKEFIATKIKKVKLWDKTKAIDLMGKALGMFVEKHVHEGTITLRDLVLQSINEEEAKETQKTGLLIKDK